MAEDELPPNFVSQADFVNALVRWNRRRLTLMTETDEKAEQFVEDLRLLPHRKSCDSCGSEMMVKRTVKAILEAAEDGYLLDNSGPKLSRPTVADYYSFCREVIVNNWHQVMENREPMGGPGTVVEIDESKFGRRKYNRGRRVYGHWVVGLIQRDTKELRMIICPWCPTERPDGWRDAEALLPLIQKNVAVGTTIHTDKWAAYNALEALGYDHKVVNHSDPDNPFVAPDGTHTNAIEASWRPAKVYFANKRIPQDRFGHALVEYGWRKHCQRKGIDTFDQLLSMIRLYYQEVQDEGEFLPLDVDLADVAEVA